MECMEQDDLPPELRDLKFLVEEYVQRGLWVGRHHPMDDGFYDIRHGADRLRVADETLRFLRKGRRDPYQTLRDVPDLLDDSVSGLRRTKEALAESGYQELLDDHMDTLMSAVASENLPPEEEQALLALGFVELARTYPEVVDLVGQEWRNGSAKGLEVHREFRREPASAAIDTAIERIQQHASELREAGQRERDGVEQTPEVPRKKRKWWKGVGQIVQGASLAITDVGLAVGALKFPVSPETQTYGAVVSVSAGVGTIMNGVGDLWGE